MKLSRFNREHLEQPISLTPRDIAILDLLRRFRFLRSTHIAPMVAMKFPDSSEAKIKRRLQVLFHGGYVDRPKAQRRFYVEDGSQPMIYALASDGVKALRDYTGAELLPGVAFKNKIVTQPHLMHTCAIADVLCAIELAAGDNFISSEELLKTADGQRPLSWQVKISGKDGLEEIGVRPDGFFGIKFPDGKAAYFFLEADRGTMPVVRTGPRQTSLLQKAMAYRTSVSRHKEMFGIDNIRTLFVLPSKERAHNFLKAILDSTEGRGSRLLMQATYEDFQKDDVLNVALMSGKGEVSTLSDK